MQIKYQTVFLWKMLHIQKAPNKKQASLEKRMPVYFFRNSYSCLLD